MHRLTAPVALLVSRYKIARLEETNDHLDYCLSNANKQKADISTAHNTLNDRLEIMAAIGVAWQRDGTVLFDFRVILTNMTPGDRADVKEALDAVEVKRSTRKYLRR